MSLQDSADRLPRSKFDTHLIPDRLAVASWHESMNVLFDPRPHVGIDEGFHARVDAALVGELGVGRVEGSAQDFDRSRNKIARDGMDGYLLQFYLAGKSASRSGDAPATGPGDLYVIDMTQPLMTRTSEHDQISIIVPRQRLAPSLNSPDDCHQRVLSAGLPLVSLLRDTLQNLFRQFDAMTVRDGELAAAPILALAAAAINSQVTEQTAKGVELAGSAAIRRHIEDHLLDRKLTVETVMAQFGLSRRTLYRMLEPHGGFASYVAGRRLRRARDTLRSPDGQSIAIADLARSHGFLNPEHFSRAFRREFGLAPRQLRDLATSGNGTHAAPAATDSDWSSWIAQIGG